ncbi:MAG: SDR family oxidoreductase [Acidobacteria bacterium]|nr:SDR family oxidoreductase [Acidobacteriota bacterium]MBU4331466.1 SDR family oxidoreductase [Acidobacteriota bacterium]MBU4496196.1 SDR family oxidoreductase [Acidobacteriota bacterium]MCG2817115.1 SDR family oxidoreductase [Candidatus Aminicenantes bacterium]
MTEKRQVVLVTGSAKGIGREIALKLADQAVAVGVHGREMSPAAEAVAAEIQKRGAEGRIFAGDLTDEREAARVIGEVEAAFGRIDILVNTVGPMLVRRWEETDGEDWQAQFTGNVLTALHSMQAVLPGMRQRKRGRIVNLGYSRVEQIQGYTTIAPYAAAKTALLILTRSAARSEAPHGITVNMVSPGLMEGGVLPADQNIPAGRLGTFADVAAAVAFLVSDEAAYITGTNIIVAGGWKL